MNMLKNLIYGYLVALLLVSFNANAMLKHEMNDEKKSWYFEAYLDDSKIGHHTFEVNINDTQTTVLSQAEFDVSILFIPVFKYEHTNNEVWNNGCLVKLNSTTFNDGEDLFVNLSNDNGITHIETAKNKLTKSECVRSFAYWDAELIKSNALLNTQTGEVVDITYKVVGSEKIMINDISVDTQRYQLLGKDESGNDIDINLWYNNDKQWVALESKLENGRYLRYQLKQDISQ